MHKILFVCLGNICRSPTAEAVFRHHAEQAGLPVFIESAGTSGIHKGEPPDRRTRLAGEKRGYDFTGQISRPIWAEDFEKFDLIFAMDRNNLRDLQDQAPPAHKNKPELFLSYAPHFDVIDVPDPYYGGKDGFEQVLDLIEAASEGLVAALKSG